MIRSTSRPTDALAHACYQNPLCSNISILLAVAWIHRLSTVGKYLSRNTCCKSKNVADSASLARIENPARMCLLCKYLVQEGNLLTNLAAPIWQHDMHEVLPHHSFISSVWSRHLRCGFRQIRWLLKFRRRCGNLFFDTTYAKASRREAEVEKSLRWRLVSISNEAYTASRLSPRPVARGCKRRHQRARGCWIPCPGMNRTGHLRGTFFFCKAQAMIAERKIRLCKLLSSESETIEIKKPCSTIVWIFGVSGKRFRQLTEKIGRRG